MKTFRKPLIPLAILIAGSAMPAVAEELDADAIRSELVGRTILWWEAQGWRHGYLHLGRDGRAEMTVDRPLRSDDAGRWVLRGSEICTEWADARDGAEKCYRIERRAEGGFLTTGGNVFEVREAGV